MESKRISIIDLAICDRFMETLTGEQKRLFPDIVKALHEDSVFGCKTILKEVFDLDRRDTYEKTDRKHLETDLRIVVRKLNKYGNGDVLLGEPVA